jgi:RHS repeat-associated protein
MSFGPDGSLYFVDTGSSRIRRIGIDGVIKTVPGGELTGFVRGIALGPDGSIYYAEAGPSFNVIRQILPDGSVIIVAGDSESGFNGEVGMATQTLLDGAIDVAFAPDERLYVLDNSNNRIRRVGVPIAGASAGELLIPSDDGGELFFFTSEGQHQKTIHALTGALISRFGYNSAGRLESVTDGDGNMTRLLYDASGNPTAIVAPGGQRSILTVDPHGYLASVTHPSAEPYQLTHTAEGLLTSLTDPRGGLHRFTYNARGLLIKDENPAGGSSTLARTETLAGHTTTLTSALGAKSSYQVTQLSPEELSRVVTTPAGARTEGLESGAETTVTQPNGVVTTLSYGPDPRWGLLAPLPVTRTQVTPGGLSQSITLTRTATLLDPSDLLSLERYTETMSINGRDYSTTYETATRQYVETSPAGRQRTRTLDAKGNTVKLDIAPSVSPATFDYDARGRMSRMAQGAQSATFAHDARDRVISRTNAAGGVIRYDFDDSDRLRSTTLPSGRMYRFDYDANGNRTRITMPSGAIHGLTYTAGDLLASYAPPSGASLSQSYDLDTRITQATLSSGRSVDAAYDATGRLTGRFFPEASVGFTYGDATERLSTVTRTPTGGGPAQSFGYTYDGELWKTLTFTGPATGTFTYRYDSNFFLVGLRFTGLPETVLTYDADGQVKSFGPFTWTHGGPHGTTTSIADARLKSTFVQDSLGRLQGRTDTVASRPLYAMQLTYDAAGRTVRKVESVAGTSHTFAYAYDADSQLVQVHQDGALLEQYAYDVNGNRTHRTWGASAPEAAAYDGRDQLQRSGTTDYTFDADGFLIQRGNEHFTYSTHGELLRYVSGATTVTYGYDGIGRRTSRTSSAGTEQYLYGNPSNPFQLTHSRDTAGRLSQFFYDETGRLFALERGGSRYYVGADSLGTPRVVSSAEGAVVKTLEHDAFGVLLADSAPGFGLPIGFAGGLQDPVTGLVRFGLRDYEPATGRWTARDPLLFDSAEANLYLYVNNNPVGLRDPVGLFSVRAAAYLGVGLGGTVAITSKGLSFCGEVGAGLGETLQVDLFGKLNPTGVSLKAAARINVGGAGAELTAELSRVQCSVRGIMHVGSKSVTTDNLLQGPRTGTDELPPVENGVRHTNSLGGEGKLKAEISPGVSAQVQVSVQVCKQLPF